MGREQQQPQAAGAILFLARLLQQEVVEAVSVQQLAQPLSMAHLAVLEEDRVLMEVEGLERLMKDTLAQLQTLLTPLLDGVAREAVARAGWVVSTLAVI